MSDAARSGNHVEGLELQKVANDLRHIARRMKSGRNRTSVRIAAVIVEAQEIDDALARSITRYEAARDAVEDLCKRYGATVEWDSEGLPSLSMPRSA
jgi:DNA-binding transcriptional MocR family regulator